MVHGFFYLLPWVKVGESNADPLAVIVSSGIDSLTVGIVSAAPSISDVSASPNLDEKKFRYLLKFNIFSQFK